MIPNRKAQTIIVSGLRPRSCDIYFAVFDQSGNQRPSKVMASIPADVIHKVTLHAGNGAVIAEGKDVTQYAEGRKCHPADSRRYEPQRRRLQRLVYGL